MTPPDPPAADILVVDDDPGQRLVFTRLLTEAGHGVHAAATIDEALALVERHEIAVVLCDIMLGMETGLAFLERVKELDPRLPVVMVTGYPTLETVQEALRHGAFDYLTKPVMREALYRVMQLAIGQRRLMGEKERLQHHLEAVFDSVEEALITVDPELRVVAANAAARRLCGIGPDQVGRPLGPEENPCGVVCGEALRQARQSGRRVALERQSCHHRQRSGQVVSLVATPLLEQQGRFTGILLTVRDETRLVSLERDLGRRQRLLHLVGTSSPMQSLFRLIEDLAVVESTVLITGESGTGKELVAEAIHRQGERANRPLVKVNCAALSDTLLESELFGHVRGAFTGAIRDREGRFKAANGGTLFLDEIGDISPAMQVRLLRVLQEKSFERVGDNRSIQVDVRVIAATNQDLAAKVARREFREDLYYRLKVVELHVPPLRERRGDIPLLVDHFVDHFNREFNKRIQGVTREVMARLVEHSWPGNVRELEHLLERAFVVCHVSRIDLEHLPPEWRVGAEGVQGGIGLPEPGRNEDGDEEGERQRILESLAATNWHREKAAQRLGLSRSTFFRRLKQLGIGRNEAPG